MTHHKQFHLGLLTSTCLWHRQLMEFSVSTTIAEMIEVLWVTNFKSINNLVAKHQINDSRAQVPHPTMP